MSRGISFFKKSQIRKIWLLKEPSAGNPEAVFAVEHSLVYVNKNKLFNS